MIGTEYTGQYMRIASTILPCDLLGIARLVPEPQSETAIYDYGPSHVPMSRGAP